MTDGPCAAKAGRGAPVRAGTQARLNGAARAGPTPDGRGVGREMRREAGCDILFRAFRGQDMGSCERPPQWCLVTGMG